MREYVASLDNPELLDLVAGGATEGEGAGVGAGEERGSKGAMIYPEARGGGGTAPQSHPPFLTTWPLSPQHKREAEVAAGLQRGLYHQGRLRVQRYNCFQALVGSESLGAQVLICGRADMNRAMEGDVVALEMLPEEEWRGGGADRIAQEEGERLWQGGGWRVEGQRGMFSRCRWGGGGGGGGGAGTRGR